MNLAGDFYVLFFACEMGASTVEGSLGFQWLGYLRSSEPFFGELFSWRISILYILRCFLYAQQCEIFF